MVPQFLVMILISIAFGAYIVINSLQYQINNKILIPVVATLVVALTSGFLSGSVISSFTGDTGRYAGIASLFCLFLISLFHSNFSVSDFTKLIRIYLIIPIIESVLAILQKFEFIDLPGAWGAHGTFGNEDFFAAFIGISTPLFIFAVVNLNKKLQFMYALGFLISIYALYLSGPLQSLVDIIISIIGLTIYKFRNYLPDINFSLNIKNAFGVLAVVIWTEFIFLFPFLGEKFPILGNDVQVKIRANFWLAGSKQFFSHPIFGVGPDQYGNYYEQFRTNTDAKNYTQILSNDAHSSAVQTLATLGIVGSICFLILIAILIRSMLILWQSRDFSKLTLFPLYLFIFVYFTNSLISPMTMPSKYLFWAISGWLIGKVYLSQKSESYIGLLDIRFITLFLISALAFIGFQFGNAQIKYISAFENLKSSNLEFTDYKFNPYIPCYMYFDGQFIMANKNDLNELKELANKQLDSNPRCIAANIVLAQVAKEQNDIATYKTAIYELVEMAPARSQVLNLALDYANTYRDISLLNRLKQIMRELNLLYIPGSAG